MVNWLTLAPRGTGNRYVASSGRSVWLRNVCSTVVPATWSSMATVTLWLTIASGGSFTSSGTRNPAGRACWGAAGGASYRPVTGSGGRPNDDQERNRVGLALLPAVEERLDLLCRRVGPQR